MTKILSRSVPVVVPADGDVGQLISDRAHDFLDCTGGTIHWTLIDHHKTVLAEWESKPAKDGLVSTVIQWPESPRAGTYYVQALIEIPD